MGSFAWCNPYHIMQSDQRTLINIGTQISFPSNVNYEYIFYKLDKIIIMSLLILRIIHACVPIKVRNIHRTTCNLNFSNQGKFKHNIFVQRFATETQLFLKRLFPAFYLYFIQACFFVYQFYILIEEKK